MRKYTFIMITLALALALVPFLASNAPTQAEAPAAPPAFKAMLYNHTRGEIVVVDQSGSELARTTLPSLGSQTFSEYIEVSPNGNRVAYVLTDTNNGVQDLLVYDRNQATIVGQFRIPNSGSGSAVYHSMSFPFRSAPFAASNQSYAFGWVVGSTWEITVLDLSVNNVLSRLHSSVAQLPGGPKGQILPVPRQFDGQYVDFVMMAPATGGAAEYPDFRWNTLNPTYSSNVQQIDALRTLDGDYLGSEQIMTVPDYRLPNVNHQIRSPFPQINAVHVAPSPTSSTFPVFSDEYLNFSWPRFIQNGARVAVYGNPALSQGTAGWYVVDRNGAQVGMLGIGTLDPHELLGVSDGLIYSAAATDINQATGYLPSRNAATTALMYIDTTAAFANNPGQRIWLGQPNEFPRLAWVSNRGATTGQPNWSQLSVPSGVDPYDPNAACTTSAQLCGATTGKPLLPPDSFDLACIENPGTCQLGVDLTVQIHTTEGDPANVRSGPGLDYEVVTQVNRGDQVQIIGGPELAADVPWWQIQTPDGATGWIVEHYGGVQVLVPPLDGEPVPVEPVLTPLPEATIPVDPLLTPVPGDLPDVPPAR